MLTRAVAVVVVAHAAVVVAAPERVVHGRVIDRETGHSIEGAGVLAERRTAKTDGDGKFEITIAGTEQFVVITAPGYAMRIVPIDATALVELVAADHEVIEVQGRAPGTTRPARPFSPPPRAEPPGEQTYTLTASDLRMLPGTANDALRAAQVLPGVARLPYSFGGMVLRGTAPRDNAVYLDGVEVPLAFHFGGVTSFYPSGMLDALVVANSGLDAGYGRSQGGAVMLTSREPRTDTWRVGGSVGLLDTSVYAEGPTHGGGIIMGVRRSYMDIVAAPLAADDTPLPNYWDAQVRSSFPVGDGRIAPMVFFALDHLDATKTTDDGHEDESTIDSFFIRFAAPYERRWGPLALRLVPWFGTNQLSFTSSTKGTVETFERPYYPAGVRSELSREYAWGRLRTGVELQGGYLSHFQAGLGHTGDILQQMNGSTDLDWADEALWSDARFSLGRIDVRPGLRLEHYGLTGEGVVDPRIAVRERLTDTLLLRETVGRYHQPPTPGDVDPNGGNPRLRSSYFDTASFGVESELGSGWASSLTGFYGYGQRIGVREGTNVTDFVSLGTLGPTFALLLEKQLGLSFYRENVGRARNRGIELLIQRRTERWFGLIAYTLAQAERTDDPRATMLGWRPFELDQRHNLNLAGSMALSAWRLGARLQVVSGAPYSPLIGTTSEGDPIRDPFADRLPIFFQLDLRADRYWPQCWGTIDLYFDIQNATNHSNVEGREPDELTGLDSDIHGLPILPFIGLEFIPD